MTCDYKIKSSLIADFDIPQYKKDFYAQEGDLISKVAAESMRREFFDSAHLLSSREAEEQQDTSQISVVFRREATGEPPKKRLKQEYAKSIIPVIPRTPSKLTANRPLGYNEFIVDFLQDATPLETSLAAGPKLGMDIPLSLVSEFNHFYELDGKPRFIFKVNDRSSNQQRGPVAALSLFSDFAQKDHRLNVKPEFWKNYLRTSLLNPEDVVSFLNKHTNLSEYGYKVEVLTLPYNKIRHQLYEKIMESQKELNSSLIMQVNFKAFHPNDAKDFESWVVLDKIEEGFCDNEYLFSFREPITGQAYRMEGRGFSISTWNNPATFIQISQE